MIYHFKDNLQNLTYRLKTPLKYSDDFTFIPIKINNDDILFQTPRLYTPYGVQINEKSKQYIMISFQNKENDPHTHKFLNDLQYIYDLVYQKYHQNNKVNSYLKPYKNSSIMNVKLRENSSIFDTQKKKIEEIPIYGYCSFIIHLAGIWISNHQVWFQWYILQTRVENNLSLTEYSFKDTKPIPPPPPPPPPPMPDKYKKMISMGIPSAAVNQKKQMECRSAISSDMLLSVQLKKGKPKKDIIKSDMNGFEPPSLDSLQAALRNLRNAIRGN